MSNPVQEFFAALNANPDDPEAVAGLDAALTEAEAWSDITHMVPRFARGLSDPAQQARFLYRAAHVARTYAGNEELASELMLEATTTDVSADALAGALVQGFEATGDWRGMIAVAMDVVEDSGNDELNARLFNQVGRVYEDKLFERERAITCYQRAFKLDPHFTEPLRAARAVYAHAEQWSTVAKLFQIELRVTDEPEAKAALLRQLGEVQLTQIGDREKGIKTLQKAYDQHPEQEGLEALLSSLQSDDEAQGVIISPRIMESSSIMQAVTPEDVEAERAAQAEEVEASTPDVVDVEMEPVGADETDDDAAEADEVAEADETESDETEADDTAGADGAAAEDDDAVASDESEGAPADEESSAAEAEVDEVASEDAADDAPQADAAAADDVSETPAEAVAEADDAAEEEAVEASDDEGATAEADDDGETSDARGEAEPEAAQSEDQGEPVSDAAAEDEEPEEEDEPAVVALAEVVGADEALETLVLELGEQGADATRGAWAWAFELGARTERDPEELGAWLLDAVSSAEDGVAAVRALLPPLLDRKAVWTAALAGLDDAEVADPSGVRYAISFYGLQDADAAAAVRGDAGPLAAAEGAAYEFAKKGNWKKAHGALVETVEDGPEADLDAYFEQAYLAVGVGKMPKAADSLRRVLRKRKKDADALYFVKFLYRADEKWGPLAEALKAEAAGVAADDAFRRSVIYRDLIQIYGEHLPQPTNVLGAYKELVEVEPKNLQVLDEYAALLEENNRPNELVPVLRKKADAVDGDDAKVAIHLEVAQLLLDRFNNQAEAIGSFEAVLEIDDENTSALSALEDLYGKRRLWDELIDVKQRLVALADDPAEQAAKVQECAEIAATRMRDNDRAIALWNESMNYAPDDPNALEALERLHERAKDWGALADVLARRAPSISDEQERALALVKLGQIQADRLGDTEASISTYSALLEVDPENFRAKDALKKAYIELEQWDELEAFFAGQDAWPDYVRQLESLAGSVPDADTQVQLLFRAADVWTDKLDDEARATKALERVLSVDAGNYDAAMRLVPVYEARSDFKRLPPLLEVVLEREQEPENRFDLEVKLARLASDRQRDPDRAFHWFSTALEEQPHRVDIVGELETAASEIEGWDQLVAALAEARSHLAGEPAYAEQWTSLSLRLGAVYEGELHDLDAALECFDEVLENEPTHGVALDAKDGIFSRQENWDALLEVLDAKLNAADGDAERITLWERVATVHESHREDIEAAVLAHEEILAIASDHVSSLDALHRLHRANEDYDALSEALRSLIALRGDRNELDARREARLELAEICIEQLDSAAAAVEVLQQVVAEDASDARARELLERLLSEDEERRTVAQILEPLYAADEAWPKLVDVLEIQLEESDDDAASVELLRRIGALQRDNLGDGDAATDAYARLLQRAPADSGAQQAVESIAEASGVWEPVTELYEALLLELDPSDDDQRAHAVDLGERAAGFYDREMGNLDEAIRVQRRVLEIAPTRVETLVRLDEMYTRAEDWDELLRVIDDRLALTEEAGDRRALHVKAAGIWRDMIDSPNEAIGEYRRVLDLFPDDAEALNALDALYEATSDSASRAEVVEQLVRLADDDQDSKLALQNRLARIYEDELGEVPRAMELWKGILAVEPTNDAALSGLDAQLESEDYAIAASEILEPLYVDQNAPARLARLLEIRLLHVDDPDGRRALYHRISGLHINADNDVESAYRVMSRAAEEFLGDTSVIDRLFELAGELGAYDRVGDTLERLAGETDDPQAGRDALARVAGIRETQIGDLGAAAELWRQVLEENPTDRDALDALERLDVELDAWDELVDVLLRKAELPDIAGDTAQVKPLMFRAAGIHEQMLEQHDEAIEVLRNLQMIDPTDADALQQLERLYTVTERWEDLVENYHRKLEQASSDEERRDLYATLGRVLETQLEDPDRAVTAYRSILDLDETDLEALQALDRLFVQTESWFELKEILDRQVALVEHEDQRRNIQYRIGQLHETELGDFASAVSVYGAILAEDSTHAPTRDALQSMIHRGDDAQSAAAILEPIYQSEGRWNELVAIHRTRIEAADDPARRRELHVEIARITESQLEDVHGALGAMFAATREEVVVADLDEIERLGGTLDAWESVCELFAELWDDVGDPVIRTDLGARVARIRETKLGDAHAAISSYVRIHEEDPSDASALSALDRLYGQTEQWELLAEIVQQRVFTATSEGEGTALRLRLGQLFEQRLDEPGQAVTVYREILAQDATNGEAIGSLERMMAAGSEADEVAGILDPLYREHGDWAKLVGLNQARIHGEDSPDERYRLWLDSADVYEGQLQNPEDALNALGNALFEMPADVALKDRIEALGDANGQWGMVADVYDMLLEQDLDDTDRMDVALRLASARVDKLGDVAGAENAYRAALEVEPGQAAALHALDGILTDQERWSELDGVLAQLRDAVFDPTEQVALGYRHATLYRDRLERPDRAIETFEEVLEIDPSHRASLDALIALFSEGQDWEALFEAYERLSMLTTDDDERVEVTVRMARLATQQLDRPNDAIDLWMSVLGSRPNDRDALQSLAILYEQTEQYDDLARVIDQQIDQATSDDERLVLLQRSGRLWAEVLDNPDAAIARYAQVRALAPDDLGTLVSLRELYESVGDAENLTNVLEKLLALDAIDHGEIVEVQRQLGTLYADTLMRPDEAVRAWRAVVALDPADGEALDRLEGLFMQQQQWEPAVEILEMKLARTGDLDDKIDLLKQIAQLWSGQLQNDENAAGAWERVLEFDIGDFDAVSALETIYEGSGQWQELASLCLDRLDAVDDPWDRVQLLRRAAGIYDTQLEQPESAFVIMGTAAQESPGDADVRAELVRLADVADKHAELAQTYAGMIAALEEDPDADTETVVSLLLSLGRLQDERLGASQEAEITFERVLGLDAENEEAIGQLETIFARTESWASLVGVLRRRVNLAFDPHDQVALHKRIGRLFEEKLDDTIEAVEAYKMAIRIDDTDAEALGALERIYEQTGEWRDLVEVLERKAENTFEPAEQVALNFRMGRIWQTKLGVAERAVESYKAVLDHDPGHLESLQALEALYASLDKWERFLDVVDAQLGIAQDDDTRAALFAKQALVQEQHFDDVDAAVGSLLNILAFRPNDLDAITNLERIYEDQEQIPELIDTLERHAQAVDDVAEQTDVLCRVGQVQVEHLDDAHAAIETYRRVLEIDAGHADALARIGALYEHVEHPEYAVQAYERLADVSDAPEAKLRLLYRAGQLLFEPLGELDNAAERFVRCLDIAEDFIPAMEALEKVHGARGDWESALGMLHRQIEHAAELPDRAKLMVRQATIYQDHLGEPERASTLYEDAIDLDPRSLAAAAPLSKVFFDRGEWVRARPMLDLLLAADVERDEDEQKALLYRSAYVSEMLEFDDAAVATYEQVLELDVTHLGALRGLARLYTRAGREDDAYTTYVEILAEHRASMEPEEAIECYYNAGSLRVRAEDNATARQAFQNALEIDPTHEPSLRALLGVMEADGDHSAAVEIKKQLLPTVSDNLERFKLLVDIGDSHIALGQNTEAEAVYREAVAIDPSSKVVLHKLLSVFTNTGNWRRATEVLGQLASMESDPERLAKLYFTIAAMFRDELGEAEQAVEFFNQALDAKFDYLEAFEAIDHLLTSGRDWEALERNYRRMYGRVEKAGEAGSPQLKVTLLKNLGEIYRSRLQRFDDAIAAYRLASQISPEDEVLITIVTELLEHTGAPGSELIKEHQRLIRISPFRLESYRALFAAYLSERRFDEAWCMAAALSLLQNATEDEERYYTTHLPPNVSDAKPNLNPTAWKQLIYHPTLDQNVTNLFALLSTHLRPSYRSDLKVWGVHKRKDKVDLTERRPLTKLVTYAINRVGVGEIGMFERQEHAGLVNMNVDPPALLAGHDMFAGKSQRELAFQVTKAVALMRPEFYLGSAFRSTDHLKVFFFAAMAAVTGQMFSDENAETVASFAQDIQALPAPVFEQVKRAVSAIVESGRNPDLSAWLRSVDHTASRVGLLLCGDLRTAVACLRLEEDRGQSISKADIKERVRELVLYSISDEYFTLRRELGLALKPK